MKDWEIYEEAAKRAISDMRNLLHIAEVRGKQELPGTNGTTYELDAIAWREDGASFLLIEVKRYTSSRLNQDTIGSIAYKLDKVGANGAIIVTPLPLQRGGEKGRGP